MPSTTVGEPRRPFRFIAAMPILRNSPAAWHDELRRIEDLGYSSVAVSDHLAGGWSMDPIVALAGAAATTSRLRLLTLVLNNDFRHPALLHRAVSMLDVLSGGRMELGIGAGWMAADYAAAGLTFDRPGIRIERLAEALTAYKRLCGDEPVTLSGDHYRLDELQGLPRPVQRPHPPVLIGGGGPRMLRLAAREAHIVGVHCRLPSGTLDVAAVEDLLPDRIDEKVRWVRSEMVRCGRSSADIELQFTVYSFSLANGVERAARSGFARVLSDIGADDSPAVVHGSLGECAEKLHYIRERYGFSYFKLGGDIEAAAPLVARLAGC